MSTSSVANVIRIRPRRGLFELELRSLLSYAELLYFLIWRDIKVRYKQTLVGVGWIVVQPLLMTLIFTVVFSRFASVPSDGIPYPLFAFAALVPWTFFSMSVTRSVGSVVSHAHLIPKVYFPRLLLPLSAVLAGLLDFTVGFALLLVLMLSYGFVPGWQLLLIPALACLALLTALAVGLWLAPLNARYRDIGHTLPFLLQFWMFASPVAYPVSIVPADWRWLYGLNPMAGVIEGFRWALFGQTNPDAEVIATSAGMVLVLLVAGVVYFRHAERGFADVV